MATPEWARMALELRGIPFEEVSPVCAGGRRVAKAMVVVAGGKPVTLVLPADREVNLRRVCGILGADEARLATDEEMARYFPEWDVPVLMDRSLYGEGDIVLRLGTHGDAIRLKFRDWYNNIRPRIAVFAGRLEPAKA